MKHKHKIIQIENESIAEELGIEPGDLLLAINGCEIKDIFDYCFYEEEEELTLLIEKASGEQWELEIEKDAEETLGMQFDQSLMDEYHSCSNKCMFCFIDQMPPGMRETLYFKDDDSRLSFLQGNYITLTNMKEEEVRRIVRYHLEPMNISFHTTNPELRCKMLHNRFAGDILQKTDILYEGGIEMNGQIVLCKGVNDGAELERTIRDLSRYAPLLGSVSVVPVGLTRYRDGLYPLEPFEKEDAIRVLEIIHRWQEEMYQETGSHFVHAGDEWYILAGQDFPEEERYDGYLQLENGVGMLRLLIDEFREGVAQCKGDAKKRELSLATGKLAAPYLRMLSCELQERYPNLTVYIYPIENRFFGEKITVSGLITGQDLIRQLQGKPLGECLLLPCNMLKSEENVFLDDLTVEEAEQALQVQVDIVKSSGQDLIEALLQGNRRKENE